MKPKRRASLNPSNFFSKSNRSSDNDLQEQHSIGGRGRSLSFCRIRSDASLYACNFGDFDDLRSHTNSTIGTGSTPTDDDFASMIGDDGNTKGMKIIDYSPLNRFQTKCF